MQNNNWASGIHGDLTVVDYMQLWERVQELPLREEEDSVRWRLTANGQYSAKTAYAAFFFGRTAAPGAPLSQKLHMWLALKNRLWTADRLQRRGLQHPPVCPLCCQGAHLLVQCVVAREIWFATLQFVGLQNRTPSFPGLQPCAMVGRSLQLSTNKEEKEDQWASRFDGKIDLA